MEMNIKLKRIDKIILIQNHLNNVKEPILDNILILMGICENEQ